MSDNNIGKTAYTSLRGMIRELEQKVDAYRNYQHNCGYTIKLDDKVEAIEKNQEKLKKDFIEKNRGLSSNLVNDNSKLRDSINIDIKKHDRDIVELRKEITERKEEFECHFRADKDYDLKYQRQFAELKEQKVSGSMCQTMHIAVQYEFNKIMNALRNFFEAFDKKHGSYFLKELEGEKTVIPEASGSIDESKRGSIPYPTEHGGQPTDSKPSKEPSEKIDEKLYKYCSEQMDMMSKDLKEHGEIGETDFKDIDKVLDDIEKGEKPTEFDKAMKHFRKAGWIDEKDDKPRNKDNCKSYNKDYCSIPCSWWKCNLVEIGRKCHIYSLKKEGEKTTEGKSFRVDPRVEHAQETPSVSDSDDDSKPSCDKCRYTCECQEFKPIEEEHDEG